MNATAGLTLATVCIPITFPGAAPSNIVGTMYSGPMTANATLLVLVTGVQGLRTDYEAGYEADDLARGQAFGTFLAGQGHPVLIIDRPANGDSPYQPDTTDAVGYTHERVVESIHDAVQGLRTGDWWFSQDAGCGDQAPGHPVARLALGGHSLGGHLAARYATLYDDIDALLTVGIDNDGMFNPDTLALSLGYCLSAHSDLAGRRFNLFCHDAPPTFARCETQIFDARTANLTVATALCQELTTRTDPTVPAELGTTSQAIKDNMGDVPAIPVHLLFMEQDLVYSAPGKAAAEQADEVELWRTGCPGCTVTTYTVPQTGHAWTAHGTQPLGFQSIVDWLAAM